MSSLRAAYDTLIAKGKLQPDPAQEAVLPEFDRIREELGLNPEASLKDIVHASINRVLSRTIWTSLTTLLAAGTLLIFGAGVIQDFAMIFVFGIITGTFSSIFIATPIFFAWHKGDRKHVEAGETPLRRYEWEVSTKESRGEA